MNLSAKVAKNTIVQITSKIISTILGLFALGFMTRYLGQEGFGEYTTIINFVSIFAIIIDFGLTLVTTQMISDPRRDENKTINNLFTLRLITALIFLGLCPLIVYLLPYSSSIKLGTAITAAAFIFVALNQVFVGLFQKRLTMDKVALAEVIGRIILLIGVVASIYFNLGLNGFLWAMVLSNLINFLVHFAFARKFVKVKLEFDKVVWKVIIKKSWPIAVTIVFNLLYLKTDTLILSLVRPAAEVGIYGSAYKIIDVVATIPFMFAGIILPILTANWIEKKSDYFKLVFQKSYDFMAILALPMVCGVYLLGRDIMILVAGPDFAASGEVFKILVLAAAAIFINSMFSHVIIAIDKQKKMIGAYVFTSLTTIIGYLYFIPKFSYIGAAWMTVYSESVIMLYAIYCATKNTGYSIKLKTTWRALLASLMMAAWINFLPKNLATNFTSLSLILISSIIIYLLALYLLKGLTKNDFKLFLWNQK